MDPMLTTVSANVLCALERELDSDWQNRNGNDPYGRLYYIASGVGHLTVKGRRYPLQPGCLYLIPACTTYSYGCPDRITIQWVHFTATLPGEIDLFAYINCDYHLGPRRDDQIPSALARMRDLWPSQRLGDHLEATGLLLNLLALFLNTADPASLNARVEELRRFQPIIDYVDRNLHSPIRVTDLARRVHLQPSYFSRLFAQHFNMPPVQYILRQKIKHAQVLLWQTDRTIETIGMDLGFTNGFYFSRAFKKIAGISPHFYRQKIRDTRNI